MSRDAPPRAIMIGNSGTFRRLGDAFARAGAWPQRAWPERFRNYYALRASVAFSLGSHDEWNIARKLNERRRSPGDFGIGNQMAIMFDGQGVTPGGFESAVADGNAGRCN